MRVSQPLWSTSSQAGPNCARLYPVIGARPLTGKVASTASAVPCVAGAAGVVDEGPGVGLPAGVDD